MTLAGLIILLLIVGVVCAVLPIDAQIKRLIYIALAVLFVLWLCAAFGVFGDWGYVHRSSVTVP